MVVNIEGFFVNEKMSRVSLDVEWRHHPEALDTFFVNQPDVPKFNFVTAGEYRYMEFPDIKVKRQPTDSSCAGIPASRNPIFFQPPSLWPGGVLWQTACRNRPR